MLFLYLNKTINNYGEAVSAVIVRRQFSPEKPSVCRLFVFNKMM